MENNIIDMENHRWSTWMKKIGSKPIFIFKASLNFIQDRKLEQEFEDYVKEILDKNKQELN